MGSGEHAIQLAGLQASWGAIQAEVASEVGPSTASEHRNVGDASCESLCMKLIAGFFE